MPEFTFIGPNGEEKTLVGPEGATREDAARIFSQSMGAKPQPAQDPSLGDYIMEGVGAVGEVGRQLGQAIKGKQDPATAGLPVYGPEMIGSDLERQKGMQQAKTTTFGDEEYSQIIASQLKDRFMGMERDQNGYPILVFKGEDGQPQRAYVNKPGLDYQDVDRAISATMPYIFGARGAGKVAKFFGGGKVARFLAQMIGASATDVAMQTTAGQMGSEQPYDPVRTVAAGAMGGLAEAMSPALAFGGVGALAGGVGTEGGFKEKAAGTIVGGVTGYAGGRALGRKGDPVEKHLKGGKLVSDEAKIAAKNSGLDLNDMTPDEAFMFAKGLISAAEPVEIATMMRTGKFGIPTTRATRTKAPMESAVEKDLRAGTGGEKAKAQMDRFDIDQKRSIREAALTKAGRNLEDVQQRAAGVAGKAEDEGVGAMINPQRFAYAPEQLPPGDLGSAIASGVRAAKKKGDEAVRVLWEGIEDVFPRQDAFRELPKALEKNLGTLDIDQGITPAASKMIKQLDDFVAGKAAKPESDLLPSRQGAMSLDRMRKRLLGVKDGAETPTDKAATNKVYRAFEEWTDDIADKGMIAGASEDVVRFRTARELTREIKSLFRPDRTGRGPENKILENISKADATPETVISEMFGSGGPTSTPKPGARQAVRAIKSALFGKGKVPALLDKQTASRTWNDMRMAYWSRLVINKSGAMETPHMMAKNIDAAFRNQASLMRELFSKQEMKIFREFRNAVDSAAFKDPNPSGTATTLRALMNKDQLATLRSLTRTQQTRERLTKKNQWMARVYQVIANKLPMDIFKSKEWAALAMARRATSQKFTPKAQEARSGMPTAIGVQAVEDDRPSNAMMRP